MPYINSFDRANYDCEIDDLITEINSRGDNPGAVNYAISRIVNETIARPMNPAKSSTTSYEAYALAIASFECAKLELYRRMVAPYEDMKAEENGDVF